MSIIDLDKVTLITCKSTLVQRIWGLCSLGFHGNWSTANHPNINFSVCNCCTVKNLKIENDMVSMITNEWLPRDNGSSK
ncbi:MAG: hypothetical protein CVV64_19085 [Candidatus Wallbacteria bacterium HGW-Wallbacteria-1]|jgi:hypothetical protein|uniref:Uncharacterized protein n=1 Tax=Candidatus Wallbacteria bacterium HGW-Wallbacteria-1 TaxID=2013854 RepID=A0A2N1PJ50_9BACT|nr:MAG: hypothetical protein CVV64_19085 [Candidatus Wallbacteria bacterium HGW-Wallbacteria-1]